MIIDANDGATRNERKQMLLLFLWCANVFIRKGANCCTADRQCLFLYHLMEPGHFMQFMFSKLGKCHCVTVLPSRKVF